MKCSHALAVVAIAAGCKHGADDEAATAAVLPPQLAAWMPKDLEAKLVGTWTTQFQIKRDGQHGWYADWVAIDVGATGAKVYDGEHEAAYTWNLLGPCELHLAKVGDPDNEQFKEVVIDHGVAELGGGVAGYRRGKAAVACEYMDKYTLDDKGTCLRWKFDIVLLQDTHRSWTSSPETCRWTTVDGHDVLTIGTGTFAKQLVADGDVLRDPQFTSERSRTEHAASYAAAKASVDARVADTPVSIATLRTAFGAKARALRGTVGDTSTLPGLFATYAADASVIGKRIEVRGVVFSWSKGDVSHLTISTSADHAELPLDCETKNDVEALTTGNEVRVAGTLATEERSLHLVGCTFEKIK